MSRISRPHFSPEPFDFSAAMRRLCKDIVERLPVFGHIRMEHVAVTFAQARRNVQHGLQAKLTPMRFEGGTLTATRQRRQWTIQRLFQEDREILYILTFYLPRFQDHVFREKMITIVHELYHIGERFDGDIRRLEGHYHVHSHSQKEYDRHMDALVGEYLRQQPPEELHAFLRDRFSELCARYGGVVGVRVPIPKLLPVIKSA